MILLASIFSLVVSKNPPEYRQPPALLPRAHIKWGMEEFEWISARSSQVGKPLSYGIRPSERWMNQHLVTISSLDFRKRRGRRTVEMVQYKECRSFDLSNKGFVLVPEQLWSKWLLKEDLWHCRVDFVTKPRIDLQILVSSRLVERCIHRINRIISGHGWHGGLQVDVVARRSFSYCFDDLRVSVISKDPLQRRF